MAAVQASRFTRESLAQIVVVGLGENSSRAIHTGHRNIVKRGTPTCKAAIAKSG